MNKWIVLGWCLWILASADADETVAVKDHILALEQEMAVALVETDVDTLTRLWAEDFMVNNPANTVLTNRDEVMERVHAGIIHYDQFEQRVDAVRVYEGIVLVMGEEIVRPVGNAPGAGRILRRRFTNIWMHRDGTWILTARHANVIPPQPSKDDE
ncbi:MAG: nuclear transport factor 2 family protein [Kiritimatiellae bacterium]|jgi:hypothetical protein|nr:nuclear transport factor 2 family protein [Kiritimatiellia bacterium]